MSTTSEFGIHSFFGEIEFFNARPSLLSLVVVVETFFDADFRKTVFGGNKLMKSFSATLSLRATTGKVCAKIPAARAKRIVKRQSLFQSNRNKCRPV